MAAGYLVAFKLAVANLKGGVGKSTTTLFVAECLALFENLRVLVIDLDPQSNASFMLLSRQGVENADRSGRTLPHHLDDIGHDRNARGRLDGYICGSSGDLVELQHPGNLGKVDLVPSVPRLWFLEAALSKRWYQENVDPTGELRLTLQASLTPLDPFSDVVLFDCPPGFSALTRLELLPAHKSAPLLS